MNMKTIKVKENIDKNGFKRLIFEDPRRAVLVISYPNIYNNMLFRVSWRGWCCNYPSIEMAKQFAESFLCSYYSSLDGCKIVY